MAHNPLRRRATGQPSLWMNLGTKQRVTGDRRPERGRRRVSVWTAVVPVAAAVAGLLFATSAQTARGTDLRAGGRTDLVDVIRHQTFEVEAAGRVGAAAAGRGGPAHRAEQPGQRRHQQRSGARPTRWRRWWAPGRSAAPA